MGQSVPERVEFAFVEIMEESSKRVNPTYRTLKNWSVGISQHSELSSRKETKNESDLQLGVDLPGEAIELFRGETLGPSSIVDICPRGDLLCTFLPKFSTQIVEERLSSFAKTDSS